MTFTFRRAITSEAKPLVGLYSESGCGKTKSALLIAKGFTGDMAKVVGGGIGKMAILLAKDGSTIMLQPDEHGLPCRDDKSSGKMISCIKIVRAAEGMCLTLPARYSAEWDDGIKAWVGRR